MIKSGDDSLRNFPQSVKFNTKEDQHSIELYSKNVTVTPSPSGDLHGSSKVKLTNIVDFTWESSFYTGQLLAIHMGGEYLAYGIKAGSGSGVVRVVDKQHDQRALLRGMRGAIQDLAFARVSAATIACIDITGCLFVHTIESTPTSLVCQLLLQVETEILTVPQISPINHRVIWCPYIPEDDVTEGEDVSKFLIVTRGKTAELWSVDSVSVAVGGKTVKLSDPRLKECGGMTQICEHVDMIVEAILSPDGTAIATASLDGEIKFFQVIIDGHCLQKPSCLHEWQPHNGKPISSMFFLDDHQNYQPDAQFWRFAITGCDNNSELKVWSCEKWVCLQTIRIEPSPRTGKAPILKAGLDLSAGFLLLSDIANNTLYILCLAKDTDDGVACVNTISEFLLPYPILSFAIVDAGLRKVRPTGGSLEDLCPLDDENEDQLVIRMYLVQPKSLQECHIAFRPARQVTNNCLMDTLTHDSLNYTEDLHHNNQNGIAEENGNEDERRSVSATIEASGSMNGALNLMTPDAFSSPAKKENNGFDTDNPNSPELVAVLSASPSLVHAAAALNAEPPLATNELEQAPPSGGSSTSREVREILYMAGLDEEEKEDDDLVDINADDWAKNTADGWSDLPIVSLLDVGERAMKDFVKFPEEKSKDEDDVESKPEEWPQEEEEEEEQRGRRSWRSREPISGANSREREEIPEKDKKIVVQNVAKDDTGKKQEDIRVTNDNIAALSNKMDSVLQTIQNQRQEIRELRAVMMKLRQDTPVTTRVESALARASQQQIATMEQSLYAQITRQNDFLDTLETGVSNKIDTALPQMVADVVEPLKAHLRTDVTRIDATIRDSLTQLIGGTQVRDAIATAVNNAAKPAIEAAFKDAFVNVVLPRMEKACQSMFGQVQEAFTWGTREYLQNVETLVEKQINRRIEHQNETMMTLIGSTASVVREEVHADVAKCVTTLQEDIARTIRDGIRDNLNQQFIDMAGARSRATTPCISVPAVADTQSRVMSLLQRGQLNAAFQQALSASDLGLVVMVCEKTEPSRVFSCTVGTQGQGPRCILQQPVILSLVQQLSADLGHRTELKHRWLEEAILNLDTNDPVTREHMGTVLMTLQNQLGSFIAANPNHRSARRMKMLAMAARALLNQNP